MTSDKSFENDSNLSKSGMSFKCHSLMLKFESIPSYYIHFAIFKQVDSLIKYFQYFLLGMREKLYPS